MNPVSHQVAPSPHFAGTWSIDRKGIRQRYGEKKPAQDEPNKNESSQAAKVIAKYETAFQAKEINARIQALPDAVRLIARKSPSSGLAALLPTALVPMQILITMRDKLDREWNFSVQKKLLESPENLVKRAIKRASEIAPKLKVK